MKTNHNLRLSAMGAAALLAAALLCASASAATVAKFIEYVQTDGNGSNNGEYVLLDYKPTANSIVEADIYLSNVTQTHGIFCARGSATDERTLTLFHVANLGLRWDYDRTKGEYETGLKAATRGVVRCAPDGLWLNGVKSSTISVSQHAYTPANKMMLFASYTCATTATPAAAGNYANMRLYSFKAWIQLGRIAYEKNDFASAASAFGAAEAGLDHSSRRLYARSLKALGRIEETIAQLKKIEKEDNRFVKGTDRYYIHYLEQRLEKKGD